MRPTRWRVAAAVGVAALTLLGCTPEETPEPSAPTPSVPPSYSDEELLEQARETAIEFQAALEQFRVEQSEDYTDLTEFASRHVATQAVAFEQEWSELGFDIQGAPVLTEIMFSSDSAITGISLTAYVCYDVSPVQVFDESGGNVTDPERPLVEVDITTFARDDLSQEFIIDDVEDWPADQELPCSSS